MTDLRPRDLPCHARPDDFVFNTSQDGQPRWRKTKIARARALCATCPLKQRCLDLELDRMAAGATTYGVYGGTTQAERGQMLRPGTRGPVPRQIEHGTRSGYYMEIRRGLTTCEECRDARNRSRTAS